MSLTMNNAFVKPHNGFLTDTTPSPPSRNLLLNNNDNNNKNRSENNNQILSTNGSSSNNSDNKTLQVWSQYKFETKKLQSELVTTEKMPSWATEENAKMEEVIEQQQEEATVVTCEKMEEENGCGGEEPAHHARRPMNAFLIFCKKHRSIVRDKYPNLENRSVTKILGEWWAVLDANEKHPFTALAREHKDAFLSANPTFKWYKLPAPPLRTCVRPNVVTKVQTPISSPTHNNNNHFTNNNQTNESVFTPGKLADESQLGSLSSLLNNNFTSTSSRTTTTSTTTTQNNNNNNKTGLNDEEIEDEELFTDKMTTTPVNSTVKTTLPLKPFKKRTFDKYPDNKKTNVVRNILEEHEEEPKNNNNDVTTQDVVDIVIDSNFTEIGYVDTNKDLVRKSGRKGKGNRYEKFMVEGRLLGNKRDTKLTSQIDTNDTVMKLEPEMPNLDLTIKRLAERTNKKNLLEIEEDNKMEIVHDNERISKNSTLSINNNNNNNQSSNFNLNLKIDNLPCLSYDVYMQRKKDSKKRKNRSRNDSDTKNNNNNNNSKIAKLTKNETQLVGSKKRKNKQSITHLEMKEENNSGNTVNDALLALATLAEVAANEQKIHEKSLLS